MTQHKAASMSASEAAAHYKATQAATRKIQGTESIGGGFTVTGGQELDGDKYIEAMKQGYRNIYDKQKAMRGKLSGLQKSWVLNYIEGATGHLEFSDKPGKCEVKQCHVFFQTMEAIEAGNLPASFTEAQLLQWADGAGLMLTAAGLDAWRRIQADTPAASDTAKAGAMVDTAKAGGLNIADTIGAASWGEIEIQMNGTGIRARKTGTDKWHPVNRWIAWDKLGMVQSQNIRYFKIFTAIAAAGGAIPKEGGRDYNSAVHDLNTKMRDAFGLKRQAFKTEGAITKSMFADISVKR